MPINAINNSSNVSFKGIHAEDMTPEKAQEIVENIRILDGRPDTFEPSNKETNSKKSPLEVIATLGVAIALSYAGARKAASVIMDAFPDLTAKAAGKIGKLADNVAPMVDKGIDNLATSSKKPVKIAGEAIENIKETAQKTLTGGKESTEGIIEASKKIIGATGAAVFLKNFTNVDGDENGRKDFLETSQNAYVNMAKKAEAATSIISILS